MFYSAYEWIIIKWVEFIFCLPTTMECSSSNTWRCFFSVRKYLSQFAHKLNSNGLGYETFQRLQFHHSFLKSKNFHQIRFGYWKPIDCKGVVIVIAIENETNVHLHSTRINLHTSFRYPASFILNSLYMHFCWAYEIHSHSWMSTSLNLTSLVQTTFDLSRSIVYSLLQWHGISSRATDSIAVHL